MGERRVSFSDDEPRITEAFPTGSTWGQPNGMGLRGDYLCASPLPVTFFSEDDMDAITTIQNALSCGTDHQPDDPYIDESVESWLGGRDCRVLPLGLGLPRYGTSWHDGEPCGPRSAKYRLFGSKQGFQVERIPKYEAIVVETGLLPWSILEDTEAASGGA